MEWITSFYLLGILCGLGYFEGTDQETEIVLAKLVFWPLFFLISLLRGLYKALIET